MNINNLALVKLTDHVDIKPYYENKKLKNTEIYDCLFNRLKLKKVQYKIDELLPYSKEYKSYNVFYINAIVPEDEYIIKAKEKYIIIEPLKEQIDNIICINDDQIIFNGEMKLSSKAKIFTDVKEAKEYLEENFTFAKIDTKEYKKIHKTIQNIQTLFNIKNYIDSSILEENINKTNEINKKYEEAFYEYLKYKLNLDNTLSLIQILNYIDLNRYKYLVRNFNKGILSGEIKYEEKQNTY